MQQAAPKPAFDERASTVNLALAVWLGLTAAGIAGLLGLDAVGPAGLTGKDWLIGLGASAVALAALFLAGPSPHSKRLQLGIVLSLMAHTGLLAGLAVANLRMTDLTADAALVQQSQPLPEAPPELVTIDRQEEAPTPDFERPLATATPQRRTADVQQREAAKLPDTMLRPAEVPKPAPVAAEAIEIVRPQTSVARAEIESGRRSRNVSAAESLAPTPAEPDLQIAPLSTPQQERLPPRPQRLALADARPLARLTPQSAPAPAASLATQLNPPELSIPRAERSLRRSSPEVAPTASAPARRRPQVLAQLGPAPSEQRSVAPLPVEQSTRSEPAAMVPLAPSISATRPAPQRASLASPPPAGVPMPGPVAPPTVSASPARPPRMASLPAPQALASAGRRSRAAPMAALGTMGQALAAPIDQREKSERNAGSPAAVQAPAGVGGLGSKPANRAGLATAASQDAVASLAPGRVGRTPSGGSPSVSGDARQPSAAFSSRGDRPEQIASGSEGSPSQRTEAAIELGLKYLSGIQQPNGSWSFRQTSQATALPPAGSPVQADAASTGLALLSYLGAGYDHIDGPYQRSIKQGLDYLVSVQSADGMLFPEASQAGAYQVARFYSHGIASIALCEAYGMTGDPRLQQPAQRALDYIGQTQVARLGGWRYSPGLNADLSVTGWQLMALRSGELAGLRVPSRTYAGVRRFLESCRESSGDRARFCYNPNAPANDPRTSHGRNPGAVMTSVGMLMQLYLGEGRESPRVQRGADYLAERLPTVGDNRQPAPTSTAGNPLRDTYYWYYGTQVMFHMGGQHWQQWNDALHPLLVDSQSQAGPDAGSWDPARPVPDKWWHLGGRLYVTTMNLLSLEVYYRHLPLYDMTGK